MICQKNGNSESYFGPPYVEMLQHSLLWSDPSISLDI
jgi:hypothetical protein